MTSEPTKLNSKSALIPVPHGLGLFIQLANSLPHAVRRGAGKGIHALTQWSYEIRDDDEAITAMVHIERYLREWPLGLQAFVLFDNDGRYKENEYGPAPVADIYHLQPLENIYVLDHKEAELQKLISTAKERFNLEIKLADEASLRQLSTSAKAEVMLVMPAFGSKAYELGDYKFAQVGLRHLAIRARQRFFFVLEAEEILYSITSPDPNEKLNSLWYLGESGALLSRLYVREDTVQLRPALLYSFVVDVQVSRVRRCGICENYFWAGRKDKRVCSERCGATSRKKRERQRYFEIKVGDRTPRKKAARSTVLKPSQSRRSRLGKKGN